MLFLNETNFTHLYLTGPDALITAGRVSVNKSFSVDIHRDSDSIRQQRQRDRVAEWLIRAPSTFPLGNLSPIEIMGYD